MNANVSGTGNNNKQLFMILGIGCAVLAVVCICFVILMVTIGGSTIAGVFALTQPAADAGETFMNALKDAKYADAYAMCSPSLQKTLVSAQGLQRLIENGKARPTQWSFTSRNINNGVADLSGSVTMVGAEGTVKLTLVQVGNEWKISSFDMKPK